MSRPATPAPENVPAAARETLDAGGAQFGFVPNMLNALVSNPAVLDIVTGLQTPLSRVLDTRTRHTIALAVSD